MISNIPVFSQSVYIHFVHKSTLYIAIVAAACFLNFVPFKCCSHLKEQKCTRVTFEFGQIFVSSIVSGSQLVAKPAANYDSVVAKPMHQIERPFDSIALPANDTLSISWILMWGSNHGLWFLGKKVDPLAPNQNGHPLRSSLVGCSATNSQFYPSWWQLWQSPNLSLKKITNSGLISFGSLNWVEILNWEVKDKKIVAPCSMSLSSKISRSGSNLLSHFNSVLLMSGSSNL